MAGRVIEILNIQTNLKTQRKEGVWAEVWVSRPDILDRVEVHKEYHGPHPDIPELQIDLASIYIQYDLQENDFIYYKLHWELGTHETTIIPVAGKIPQTHQDFARAWKAWATNVEVREGAINYLLNVAKKLQSDELEDAVRFAARKTAKYRIMNAWKEVEKKFAIRHALAYRPGHTTTWTGVLAMPIKIAKAISIPDFPRWHPPVPSPRYTTQGVLIASGEIAGYIAYKAENLNKERL